MFAAHFVINSRSEDVDEFLKVITAKEKRFQLVLQFFPAFIYRHSRFSIFVDLPDPFQRQRGHPWPPCTPASGLGFGFFLKGW